jgi:hypothetical protein
VVYSEWLKLFGSFRFLAAVILSSAILTSVAFTAAPENHATGTGHHSAQPVVDAEASR